MFKFVRRSVALAALILAWPAVAAEVYAPPPLSRGPVEPAPAYVASGPYNWTGFYVGLNAGAVASNTSWTFPDASSGGSSGIGGLAGGTIGYNLQNLGGPLVLSEEADIAWASANNNVASSFCGTNCELHNYWVGTIRLRLGYAFGGIMPYLTGGFSGGNVAAFAAGTPNGTNGRTALGGTVGAGVEFVLADPWTVKVEGLYVGWPRNNCDAPCGGGPVVARFNEAIFRVGLNYKVW